MPFTATFVELTIGLEFKVPERLLNESVPLMLSLSSTSPLLTTSSIFLSVAGVDRLLNDCTNTSKL